MIVVDSDERRGYEAGEAVNRSMERARQSLGAKLKAASYAAGNLKRPEKIGGRRRAACMQQSSRPPLFLTGNSIGGASGLRERGAPRQQEGDRGQICDRDQ